jgi:hypothetical protein
MGQAKSADHAKKVAQEAERMHHVTAKADVVVPVADHDVEAARLLNELRKLPAPRVLLPSTVEVSAGGLFETKRELLLKDVTSSPVFSGCAVTAREVTRLAAQYQTIEMRESTAAFHRAEEILQRCVQVKYFLGELQCSGFACEQLARSMDVAAEETGMVESRVNSFHAEVVQLSELMLQVDAMLTAEERLALRTNVERAHGEEQSRSREGSHLSAAE